MKFRAKRRLFLWVSFGVVLSMLLVVAVVTATQGSAGAGASAAMWTPIFTDTFDILSPAWMHVDNTNGQYQWDVEPYTRSADSLIVMDSGFWSAGGGTVGSTQSWPTGTYSNNTQVWAVAGPFTPTQKTWEMRLRLDVQNRIASGDTLFLGLSDGLYNPFTGVEVSEAFSDWRSVNWSTKAYGQSPVWVALVFTSDGQNVDAGSLVDNLVLEFNHGSETYLPMIRRDPTPTPTPTPVPQLFVDHFDDPNSGWYVGDAIRYNEWCRWGSDCHAGDEIVANIGYVPGHYRYYIPVTWQGGEGDVDTWFVWPAEPAPLPDYFYPLPERYCVEARAVIANSWLDYQPWWAHWGVVFGANADRTELYTFQINANHNYSAFRIHNYEYPGNHQPTTNPDANVEIPIIPWCTDNDGYPCDLTLIPTATYNTLKVAVKGNVVDVYVNGVKLASGDVPGMPRECIGLIGGSWETTPVELKFDYFRYDPFCPEAH